MLRELVVVGWMVGLGVLIAWFLDRWGWVVGPVRWRARVFFLLLVAVGVGFWVGSIVNGAYPFGAP